MTAKILSIVQLMLKPAVGLMHRLRYPYKFAAIGLLRLIAIAYLFIVLTANLHHAIDIARQEQAGLAFDQPLLSLIQVLQQHEGLAAAAKSGVPRLEAQRADRMAALTQAESLVDRAIGEHGGQLQLAASWPLIESRLDILRREAGQMGPEQSRDAHAALLKALLAMVAQVGDSSFLVLDPVASSYYLMDAATTKPEFGRVTVSIGVASVLPSAGDTPDRLVKAADQALYQAKEQGRNRAACRTMEEPFTTQ